MVPWNRPKLKIVMLFLAILALVWVTNTQKLQGVCDFESPLNYCTIYSSLIGKRPIQVVGSGLTGVAQDQSMFFKSQIGSTSLTSAGPPLTRDTANKSDMSRGIMYYETPSVKALLGSALASKVSTLTSEIFARGPSTDGSQVFYSCETSSQCNVIYDIAYTPFINRIYPSTVFAGHDFCFNVFTDYAAENGKSLYASAKLGENLLIFDTYDLFNQESKSSWDDYQICGTSPGGVAKNDYTLSIVAQTGEYVISNFARSYDGTNVYTVRMVPLITSVSMNTFYKAGGAILTLKGESFDAISSNNVVTVDDVSCTVFEASETYIRWVIGEKTTTTSGTIFSGGIGAKVNEYIGYGKADVTDALKPTQKTFYTDIESRRNIDDDDNKFTRIVETWFVPPQTGGYIFHAAWDDSCDVFLSTTDMDKASATKILSVGTNGWRNYWDPAPSSIYSAEQTLQAGKHYYMKVIHEEVAGNDYMSVGFKINDASTAKPNSFRGWKSIYIEPHHTFETFVVVLPNNTNANFRLQFKNTKLQCAALASSTDIFKCTRLLCPCVSTSFKATSTEAQFLAAIRDFFNNVKSYYGSSMTVTKETLDVNGAVTSVAADISSYKFTFVAKYVLTAESASEATIWSDATGVTATVTKTASSTLPISGSYRIKVPLADNTVVTTDDIALNTYNGHIMRLIYKVAPEYLGRLELKTVYSKYRSQNEGKELYYRIDQSPNVNLEITSSTTSPLTGGSTTQSIEYLANNAAMPASNTPFYEVIPGVMTRTVETKPQITLTTNGILGVCNMTTSCDVTFINDVGEITARTASSPYTEITFTGTSLPASEISYVSIGTVRTWSIVLTSPATTTSVKCFMDNMIAGSHKVVVQTTKGAIKNGASITNLEVDIEINTVLPLTLHKNGGQTLTITGKFFPRSIYEAKSFTDFAVTFTGGGKCAVISVSETQIICTTPKNLPDSAKVTVAFNGKSTEFSTAFTISTSSQTVTSVDKTQIWPVLKQDLQIVVSSTPSSNPDDYTGILANDDRTIYMRVNKVDTATKTLTVRFPGSPVNADYVVFVEYNGDRYSSTTVVSAKSSISSIQITTNSPASKSNISTTGGDTVKITGTGFSTNKLDNAVVFGDKTYAEVLSASLTELVVRAGSLQTAGEVDVHVYLKLSIESTWLSTCKITYDSTQAPTLTGSSNIFVPVNGIITIAGTGFGPNAVGYIGTYAQQTISSTSTEVKIKLTKMDDNESFAVIVRTDTVNLPAIIVQPPVDPVLLGVLPHVGSSGGERILLSTLGLGLSMDSNLNLYYDQSSTTVSVCDSISLIDSSTVACITKKNMVVPKSALKLSYTHKSSKTGKTTTVTLACATSTDCEYETSSAATPTVSGLSKTNSDKTLELTVTGFTFDSSYTISVLYGNLAANSTSIVSSSVVSGTFSDGLPPGAVQVSVSFTKGDRVTYTAGRSETITLNSVVSSPVTCSWAGGCNLEFTQASIKQGAVAGDISVTVWGQKASIKLSESTNDKLIAVAPVYMTSHALDLFKVQEAKIITGTVTSVPANVGKLAFDGLTTSMFVSYTDDNWYVQVKFDEGKVGMITQLKYFMNRMIDKQTNFVGKLKFQSSADGTTWTDVFAADKYLKEGWNTYSPSSALSSQYYRFFSATKNACQVGEIQMYGNVVENTSATSKVCDVVLIAPGGQIQTFSSQVTYADSASSVVTDVSPRYGSYKGGETVTFTGTGFSATSSEASVTIDGITWVVTSATSTQIQWTTGKRPNINPKPSTILKFTGSTKNGYASMQTNSYTYANYWSDLDTWGGEYLPTTGDSVSIPVGQTLIVDVARTPILKAVIVEGSLIFSPDSSPTHHRTFDAEYVFVSTGALFQVGTETNRYTSKLTITMHGTKESPQIPVFGDKGIFAKFGTIDMHGIVRDYTWTELATTMLPFQNQITLNVKTDWQVGEEIVIASTDFNLDHAETFKITGVDNSGTKTVLTLNTTAAYKHYSGSKTYTGSNGVNPDMTKTLEMRAEVGLLTRNVVFKGADDDSVAYQYGAHIMMHSHGDDSVIGRFSYVEFMQVGQSFQLGRYPLHFHMIGAVHKSFVRGNAFHHTYNRACTLHGIHYLTIENNVAYETMGHTIFFEDGIETKNMIKNNLVIKTKRAWSLLNTDQTPASFWITNPDNQFIGNHAAGSDRYGFWFNMPITANGPSYDPNVCPQYEQLGEFTGNVAHSNGRYGLRIFEKFIPVTNPWAALAENASGRREQPNPAVSAPIVTHFRDFLAYKNLFTGIILEEAGALKFHNIRTADNVIAGMEISMTAAGPWLTSSDDYHLQDALIVGASENIDDEILHAEMSGDTWGVKGSRNEKMRVKDTLFVNFDYNSIFAAISTCSHCEGCGTDSSGRTYFFKNLYFVNSARRVRFDYPFKEIIYDEDGTLGNSTHRWIVHYFNHLDVPECVRDDAKYDGLLCHKDISIRRVALHHPEPYNALKGLPIKIFNTKQIQGTRRNLSTVSPDTWPNTSNSLTTISTWDTRSFTSQQSLLQKYDEYRIAKEAYLTNVSEAEKTNSQTAAAAAATAKTKMDALQAEIAPLLTTIEPDMGKFDDLYKNDQNIWNTNNYQDIKFRVKAFPLKNLVFPVITGYEYKVHIGQGADFSSLQGSYSYNELLAGETKGVILHFNHTERAEAFNLKYTDSSTGKPATIAPKTALLGLTDTSMKMGDLYTNNVTRHMMIKFDGTATDRTSFTLEREECISVGGCNRKDAPIEVEIEKTYRYWSKPASWTDVAGETGALPVAGAEVIIKSNWNMVLDLTDPPVFKSIEINGRLTILNDGKTYNLQASLIYIRKGELIVGTSDQPITGKVIFTLHGTRADKDIYFSDKMFEAGNKVIANTGLLRMYGKQVGTKWTRLAQTAPAGQNWILITDDPTDWKVGDELGINPSGRDYTQRDFAVIQSINGKNITLASALVYMHTGAASIDATQTGGIDIRAEVLHLTRNIVVRGTNEDRWGGHVVTAHNKDSGFVNGQLISVDRKGSMIIDHAEFVNCSQYDTDKAAVRFSNFYSLEAADTQSSVTNSAIHNGLGIGIMVSSANNVKVDSNVVFFQHIGGIWMKASNSTTITNNVVGGMGTRYWSDETRLDEIVGFNFCNKDQNCKNLIVKNNIMGGGERLGFVMPTTSCTESSPSYENNLAHSVEHGAWILKNNLLSGCQAFRNFRAYKTMSQGVFSYQGYSELEVSGIETLDWGSGVHLMVGALYEVTNIRFKDSVLWGQSDKLPVDTGKFCIDTYGFLPATSTVLGKVVPEFKLSNLPYEKVKSDSNWFIETRASNVKFKNWKSGAMTWDSAKLHRILAINAFDSDHPSVIMFDNSEFVDVDHSAMAYLYTPPQEWAIIDDWGQFPWTGPLNTVIKFTQTSASGTVTPTITGISSKISFQIIPNNVGASEYVNTCSKVSAWNGYLCYNPRIAQLMLESLDDDTLTRTISPINILGKDSKFNSTLNSFMDHLRIGHYTSQLRLSRFPSLIETNKKYEVRFTGTQPSKMRYTIEGGEPGVDWLHLIIDFSQSRLFNIYANDVLVKANDFDSTGKEMIPIQKTKWGENVYTKLTYIYDFYLTYGCTVRFEGQDFVEGMVRLQISFTDFFSTIGNTNFIDRLTSALGITQDKLKIVRVYEGSTIVEWYITSSQSTSTQRQKELKELVDKSLALYNSGSLNLGAPILDFTSQMVTSSGTVVTTNSGTYTKKEINAAVIVILSFAALAMLIAVVVGIIKAIKMSKGYNEIVNMDISEFDKGEHKINISEESKDDHKFEPKQS